MAKHTWIALGVAVAALLIWLLLEPVTSLWLWLWGMEATERTRIRDMVQIFAGVAGGGSFVIALANFLKTRQGATKDSAVLLQAYYQALHKSCQAIDLALVNVKFTEYASHVRQGITLPEVYQDMDVVPCNKDKHGTSEEEVGKSLHEQRRKPLLQASAEEDFRRVIVLGDPGSGKSMFMDNLAWQIAGSQLSKPDERLPKDFRRLPVVRIRLRVVAWWCKKNGFGADTLLDAMQREVMSLVGADAGTATWEAIKPKLLEEGVILLDGLDEVPETDGMRKEMLDAVDLLLAELKPGVRLIITSRPYVFAGQYTYWLQSFRCLELQGMGNHQIEQFINRWYLLLRDARGKTKEAALQQAHYLFVDLLERDYLLEPARSPLILTLLTTLHFAYEILPHSRADLYREAIALMLERWTLRAYRENEEYPLEDFERKALAETEVTRKAALQGVALDAHYKKTLQIPDVQIKGLFSEHLSPDCNPANLLDFIRYRSGLLKPGEANHFEFYHRSFQDYLVALAITDMDGWQDVMDGLLRNEGTDWWSEVFLLLVSAKVSGNSKPDAIAFLLSYYVPETIDYAGYSEQEFGLLFLAARATVEQKKPLQGYASKQYGKLLLLLNKHLLQLVEGEYSLSVSVRAEAGRLLGELGDPRPGVGLITEGEHKGLPDIDWVSIASGTVVMGFTDDEVDRDFFKHSTPLHKVWVKGFQMARYPVTNAQFARFIEAGGYETERYWQSCVAAHDWWKGEKPDLSLLDDNPDLKKDYANWLAGEKTRRQPWYWEQNQWNNPNHPVVGVSWYEALAFCEWLNEQGGCAGKVRLPTEAEWEYAARGASGWRYAWGNEADKSQGNYRDTDLNRTSAVGLFAAGKAFGLHDMSGNVWEWTSSQWGEKSGSPDFTYEKWGKQESERDNLDAYSLRIIRGGSWTFLLTSCGVRFGTGFLLTAATTFWGFE